MLVLRLQNHRVSKKLGGLNEDVVYSSHENQIKGSKYLQQAEYSEKKHEIYTAKYSYTVADQINAEFFKLNSLSH